MKLNSTKIGKIQTRGGGVVEIKQEYLLCLQQL